MKEKSSILAKASPRQLRRPGREGRRGWTGGISYLYILQLRLDAEGLASGYLQDDFKVSQIKVESF